MRKAALLAVAVVMAFAQILTAGAAADAATLDSGENDLLGQINTFRSARGLSTLVVSDTLTSAAKWMATDLSVNNYFSHTSPTEGQTTPTERAGLFGVTDLGIGENIASMRG